MRLDEYLCSAQIVGSHVEIMSSRYPRPYPISSSKKPLIYLKIKRFIAHLRVARKLISGRSGAAPTRFLTEGRTRNVERFFSRPEALSRRLRFRPQRIARLAREYARPERAGRTRCHSHQGAGSSRRARRQADRSGKLRARGEVRRSV